MFLDFFGIILLVLFIFDYQTNETTMKYIVFYNNTVHFLETIEIVLSEGTQEEYAGILKVTKF